MLTTLPFNLSEKYSSNSQKVRVATESWVEQEIYCPSCGGPGLNHYPRNKPVADFYCQKCAEDFELKSNKNTTTQKIVDGAYQTMIERLGSDTNPNLFLLNYGQQNYQVTNFFVIPKYFFVPQIIEKRKPLSVTARRAGWIGCNILLRSIPRAGKIFYIENNQIKPQEQVLESWQKTLFLKEERSPLTKGWILDIMDCIDDLNKNEFTLDEMYLFDKKLQQKHSNNHFIRDKIRQQLQFLRDKNYLKFLSRGKYCLSI